MICLAEPKLRLLAQTQENPENDVPPWHQRRQSVILALWQLEKRVWTVGVRPADAGSRTVLYHNEQGTCKASSTQQPGGCIFGAHPNPPEKGKK